MIRPDQIPPEVVEAAAKAIAESLRTARLTMECEDGYKPEARAAIAAAIDLIRAEALEEAAQIAEREGVHSELNVYDGGPEWYRHGKRIAAAIRAIKEKP